MDSPPRSTGPALIALNIRFRSRSFSYEFSAYHAKNAASWRLSANASTLRRAFGSNSCRAVAITAFGPSEPCTIS